MFVSSQRVKIIFYNHAHLQQIYLFNKILSLQAFVESNPTLKWCPSPGCGQAVRLPSSMLPTLHVAVEGSSSEETEPMIVDCGKGHFFCW